MLPAVTELVPMYQHMLSFLSVRADGQGMVEISKQLDVKEFPTFIIFRGGKELERLVGHDKVIEKLIRSLAMHITPEDKIAHAKYRYRLKLEKALELGTITRDNILEFKDGSHGIDHDGGDVDEQEERGQLDWTFDPEQCGESMHIDMNGMRLIFKEEQESEDIRWEFTRDFRRNNKKWIPFPDNINSLIGNIYMVYV